MHELNNCAGSEEYPAFYLKYPLPETLRIGEPSLTFIDLSFEPFTTNHTTTQIGYKSADAFVLRRFPIRQFEDENMS